MTNCKDCNHWNDTCTNKQSDCYGQSTNADNGCVWGSSDWISVKDRLPEEALEVLIYCECGISVGFYVNPRWTILGYDKSTVTHWMPSPEPPRD